MGSQTRVGLPQRVPGSQELEKFKMREKSFNRNPQVNLVRQRVLHIWNELPEEVVEAGIITTFKNIRTRI